MTNPITRRRFLSAAALSFAASRLGAQSRDAAQVTLTLPSQAAGPAIPASFAGLSYEVEELANPDFFSPANHGLIRAFNDIAPHGVLRLGGNTSDYAWWKPTPDTPEPEHPPEREVEGEPKAQYYAVTAEAVRNLDGFLKAAGWSCIYGINLGTNTPQRAAAEAAFVAATLGPSLEYFQIGNEADLFGTHLRDPKTWGVEAYLDQWLPMARAIAARVPGAKFGLPDVASYISWLTEIADKWKSIENPPRVAALTHHYYFGGPATNPAVNIPNLLKPATMEKVQRTADIATADARKMGVRVRMTEGNTCYRGGKPGVSDVFAAALWAADYSLLLAANGYAGVNLHGGGKSVANSVGGSLPGDEMLRQQGESPAHLAAHPHPFYTPIASFGSRYVIEPVAYGLKFADSLRGGRFYEADFSARLQSAGVDATAYAAKLAGSRPSIIVLNKDAEKDLRLTVEFGAAQAVNVEVETLHAPALDSREAQITPAATARTRDGKYTLTVPHASGVRLTVG